VLLFWDFYIIVFSIISNVNFAFSTIHPSTSSLLKENGVFSLLFIDLRINITRPSRCHSNMSSLVIGHHNENRSGRDAIVTKAVVKLCNAAPSTNNHLHHIGVHTACKVVTRTICVSSLICDKHDSDEILLTSKHFIGSCELTLSSSYPKRERDSFLLWMHT
jgi:hypothetical protein